MEVIIKSSLLLSQNEKIILNDDSDISDSDISDDTSINSISESTEFKKMFIEIPETIIIDKTHYGFRILSNKNFKKNDIIFKNKYLLLPIEDTSIIGIINNIEIQFDMKQHAIRRDDNMAEFYFFDSFMNHSCDPNVKHVYTDNNEYCIIATKNIDIKEELMMDYDTIDWNADDFPFDCCCNSKSCRKYIKGFKNLDKYNQNIFLKNIHLCPYIKQKYLEYCT